MARTATAPRLRRGFRRTGLKQKRVDTDEEGREAEDEQPDILIVILSPPRFDGGRQRAPKGVAGGFVGQD
jgi:hypothetical protein